MTQAKKRIAIILVVLCFLAITSISVFASSPVYCAGGDAGTDYYTHWYWFLQTHTYATYSHFVDRVYDGHIWRIYGHTNKGCGENDYQMNCIPGVTIVGEAP